MVRPDLRAVQWRLLHSAGRTRAGRAGADGVVRGDAALARRQPTRSGGRARRRDVRASSCGPRPPRSRSSRRAADVPTTSDLHAPARAKQPRRRSACSREAPRKARSRRSTIRSRSSTNRPVSFRAVQLDDSQPIASATSFVSSREGTRRSIAPLVTVLRYGRKSRHVELPVRLSVAFTEVGHAGNVVRIADDRPSLAASVPGAER